MSIGLPNNGSEQAAQLELHRVLDAIRNKTGLDPREVYRTPDKNQGERVRQISFRVDDEMYAEVEKIVRAGDRFLNMSECGRQAIALWLSIEAELTESCPSPAILKMMRDSRRHEMDTIDDLIKLARDELESADGEIAREETRARLNTLMDYCKTRGYEKRINGIRKALGAVPPLGLD